MADFAGAIDFDCTAALLERNGEEEGGGGALTVAGSDEASWPSDLSCFDFFFFFFGFSPLKTSSPLPMMRVVGGWLVWYGMVLIEKDGERWLVMVALVWVVMRVVSEKESFVSPIEARNKQCAIGK